MKTLSARKAGINRLIGAGAEYNGALIGLFKTAVSPTPRTALADLTPADFTGYAISAGVTWGTVGQDESDRAVVTSNKVQFAATGAVVGNTIFGHYVVTADGLTLLEVVPFGTPIGINESGDFVDVVHRLTNPGE